MQDVIVCHCSCPDHTAAERIAQTLVDEQLAACVQILPGVVSMYRWQAATERASETLLVIKTAADRLDALCARVVSLHPYDVPELIATKAVGGLDAYLNWVRAATRPPDTV